MNALQVQERSHLSPDELVGRLKATAPRSVRKRFRTPRLMRTMPMKLPVVGKDSYGYLSDVIITRDVWMHHIDITRAASKELEVTADYDGRLIADVVADWGRRHGGRSGSSSRVPRAAPTSRMVPMGKKNISSTPWSSVASCRGASREPGCSRTRHCSEPSPQKPSEVEPPTSRRLPEAEASGQVDPSWIKVGRRWPDLLTLAQVGRPV